MPYRPHSSPFGPLVTGDMETFQPRAMNLTEFVEEFEHLDTSTCVIYPSGHSDSSMP